jgi:ABC-type Zn2+ transport system substrate-binding protein/surface adhesin
MDPSLPHSGHDHDHDHDHDHGGARTHAHGHGSASPHPAQVVPWSILRMTVWSRLAAAVAVSTGLWAMVWIATR